MKEPNVIERPEEAGSGGQLVRSDQPTILAGARYGTEFQCLDDFNLRLHGVWTVKKVEDDLEQLYHNQIGKLRDILDINLPYYLKEHSHVWGEDTIEEILPLLDSATKIIDKVRVGKKPYEPLGIKDIRERLVAIEKTMVRKVADDLVECACD